MATTVTISIPICNCPGPLLLKYQGQILNTIIPHAFNEMIPAVVNISIGNW
jgi:hypothetical protein